MQPSGEGTVGFGCGFCGKQFRGPAKLRGKEVECRSCGQAIRISENAPVVADARPRSAPESRSVEMNLFPPHPPVPRPRAGAGRPRVAELRAPPGIVDHRVSAETCHFCRSGDVSAPLLVDMHRVLGRSGRQVSFQTSRIPVPRCGACRTTHDKFTVVAVGVSVVVSVIVLLLTMVASDGRKGGGPGMGELIMSGLIGVTLFYLVRLFASFSGANTARAGRRHPLVERYREDGWRFGSKPS